MKKQLVVILFFIAVAVPAMAQRTVGTAIKWNPMSRVAGTWNFSVEQKILKKFSFQLGYFNTTVKFKGQRFNGYGITPEFRWYITGEPAIKGLYVAPYFRYNKVNIKGTVRNDNNTGDIQIEADLMSYGGGAVVGYQWVVMNRVTFDLFAGLRGMGRNFSVKAGNVADFKIASFGGFGARMGGTVGVAF